MQREKQEYFIPNIEDLRVGYEYERQYTTNIWINEVIEEWDFRTPQLREPCDSNITEILRDLNSNKIRVPYLTKQQIEAEGWIYTKYNPAINLHEFRKVINNHSWYTLDYFDDCKNIIITKYWTNGDDDMDLFNGECKDINTFRYICKLLNI